MQGGEGRGGGALGHWGVSGIEPFPRVTQDLMYVGGASSEVWLGNDKRLRGQREEGSWRERRSEGSQGPDCSPGDGHYILYEIYSLQRSSREFSLLGSLFVDPTVPDSSWHVETRMEQIGFHLCSDWNARSILQTSRVVLQAGNVAGWLKPQRAAGFMLNRDLEDSDRICLTDSQ